MDEDISDTVYRTYNNVCGECATLRLSLHRLIEREYLLYDINTMSNNMIPPMFGFHIARRDVERRVNASSWIVHEYT